jgi:hypothetical protein
MFKGYGNNLNESQNFASNYKTFGSAHLPTNFDNKQA